MLPEITDEFMQQMRTTTKNYTLMILKQGPEFIMPGVEKISGNMDAGILV